MDTLEKGYVTNIYSDLKFRVQKHDTPCALEKTIMAEVQSWSTLNVLLNLLFTTSEPTLLLINMYIWDFSHDLSNELRLRH